MVILGVAVRSTPQLSLCPISARVSVQLRISFWDQFVVETSCGQVICWLVQSCRVEHFARLLCQGLTQVSVNSDAGKVALVPGNNSRLLSGGEL